MKILLNLFLILCLLFVSEACSTFEEADEVFDSNVINKSSKRSLSEVLSIASQYSSYKSSSSRSQNLIIDEKSIIPIVSSTTRSLTDTLIYSVDFKDNKGFILISANKGKEPILAIVDNGKYLDSPQEIQGFEYFLENAKNYVSSQPPISKDTLPKDHIYY